ncbi:RNA polymerase subunit Rpo13 [Acidianus brierleyi]|uniref:RNA polymerase Rpo13 n=1 Tax=Acidianus brierleyi TaxID=41673 RepID=A0A2U9IEQ3_9CREN|nr:RNA polymerase subunit Rpo13 [Acidianus brierleyi]AWR94518.1 RNA polymerase Rpo13 [Acidianus brierleyi]
MSDEYNNGEENEETTSEEKEPREEDSEFPAVSLQDIELLMKNTEVWYELLNGKISLDDAKKLFEQNISSMPSQSEGKKAKRKAPAKKVKKEKVKK